MSISRRAACGALLAGASFGIVAQDLPMRVFPPSVKFATLNVASIAEASLNKEAVRLSPGFRLFTSQNMVILANMVVNQPVKVAYTLDTLGLVQQAWILSENEVQAVEPLSRGLFSFPSKSPFQ